MFREIEISVKILKVYARVTILLLQNALLFWNKFSIKRI